MIITGIEKDRKLAQFKCQLLGSFLFFTQTFFKLQTGRDFVIHETIGRESHVITMSRCLTDIFYLKIRRFFLNIPPGHGKSTMLTYFVPWCFAHYADCKFIYTSNSHSLAQEHTYIMKTIMEMPEYGHLFGVYISKDSAAKDNFKTSQGGAVKAFGSGGGITGHDAGIPNLDRFSGCVLMDDMHKPDEVSSDVMRDAIKNNYNLTLKQRPRAPNVPMLAIGQRLHEDDIFTFFEDSEDGEHWESLVLQCEDGAGNILCPYLTPRDMVERLKSKSPYVWWSQFQQQPQPAGGTLFKEDRFHLMDEEPHIQLAFLTVDTAETNKDYNDATVFSFFGLYRIKDNCIDTNKFGLHCINCVQMRVEPFMLESEFLSFYRNCLLYKVKPSFIGIEKKSTGVTLSSVLSKVRGLNVRDIERTSASGSKTNRFIQMQPYISEGLISFHRYAKHTKMCIEHLCKITANDTHAHDDIADTFYDAIKIALIDPLLINQIQPSSSESEGVIDKFNRRQKELDILRQRRWQR